MKPGLMLLLLFTSLVVVLGLANTIALEVVKRISLSHFLYSLGVAVQVVGAPVFVVALVVTFTAAYRLCQLAGLLDKE